ncbi:hypothetical protein [Anaerophaga thermohalophila]|uniref:hypothetical protein n=1 Tax=Anaerophaga thermohalophila TaxID=177400 RepID=UPI000237BCD7|nr:hypothetical protein [Anaerophaga thermohalophila]
MLINLSNHPSSGWSETQLEAAREWGQIVDLPFPVIDPEDDSENIKHLAVAYLNKLNEMLSGQDNVNAVHLMGEHTFCFAMARLLQKENITCMVSTTHRMVTYESNGEKTTRFRFVRFRRYPEID